MSGSVVWLVCLLICVLFRFVVLCLAVHAGAQSTVLVLRSCVFSQSLLFIVFDVFRIPMFNVRHLVGSHSCMNLCSPKCCLCHVAELF